METEPNVVKEAITHPIAKDKTDTVNKIDRPQASKSLKNKSISNKSDKSISLVKSMPLDKSRSTRGTEI